jgi:predicted peptidase
LSYGGFRAYDIAFQNPAAFAAIVPISASICEQCITNDPALTFPQAVQLEVGALKTVPIWQFHGATDTAVPVAEAQAIRDAFTAAGAPYKYTEYPNVGHEIWDTVYADPTMWSWLYAQRR